MRQVVVYAFYVWLALSFLYLVVQMVRRATGGTSAPKPRPASTTAAAVADDPDPVSALLAEENQLAEETPLSAETSLLERAQAGTGALAGDAANKADPDTLRVPGETVLRKPEETLARVPETVAPPAPADPTPAVSLPDNPTADNPIPTEPIPTEPVPTSSLPASDDDLDALPPPPVDLSRSAPDAAQPMAPFDPVPVRPEPVDLASLLAGIRLPNDLMPVIPEGQPASPSHVSLLTSSAPAAVVGPAIADELERLGYTLEPRNDDQLLARRNSAELLLGIETSPALLLDGGRPRYPSAVDGDVLITIDVA